MVIRVAIRRTRADRVADAKKHGGQVVLGGAPMDGMGGYFLQPTVIKNMSQKMLTTREETFAPVVGYVLPLFLVFNH